jgi:hypothetical protein
MFFFSDEKTNFTYVQATKYDKLPFNIYSLLDIVQKWFIILVNYKIWLKCKCDYFPDLQGIYCWMCWEWGNSTAQTQEYSHQAKFKDVFYQEML